MIISVSVEKILVSIQVSNKWKDIPSSWIRRINIAKKAILAKPIYRFNTIPIKIPSDLFVNIDNLILKFTWKFKGQG